MRKFFLYTVSGCVGATAGVIWPIFGWQFGLVAQAISLCYLLFVYILIRRNFFSPKKSQGPFPDLDIDGFPSPPMHEDDNIVVYPPGDDLHPPDPNS